MSKNKCPHCGWEAPSKIHLDLHLTGNPDGRLCARLQKQRYSTKEASRK